jgi:hypothetical protein
LELKEREQASGNRPTKEKATTASELALLLTNAIGRYSKIMEPLVWELLNSIFLDFAAVETRLPREQLYGALDGMATYFDKYQETKAALEEAQCELGILQKGSSMGRLVKKFQTVRMAFDHSVAFIRDACFLVR